MEKKPTNPFAHKAHPYEQHGGGAIDRAWFSHDVAEFKKSDADPRWPSVNPDELTDYDIRTWMWWRAGNLEFRMFANRLRNLKQEHPLSPADAAKDSRYNFYAILGERFTEEIAKEQLADMEQAKK